MSPVSAFAHNPVFRIWDHEGTKDVNWKSALKISQYIDGQSRLWQTLRRLSHLDCKFRTWLEGDHRMEANAGGPILQRPWAMVLLPEPSISGRRRIKLVVLILGSSAFRKWLDFAFIAVYKEAALVIGEGNGNTLQYSCLENPVDRGAWQAAVHSVAQSQTRLKRLSMHACIGEGNGNPLQCSCLENPRDRGVWWAAIHGVAQSRTRLKRLKSSSSSSSGHAEREGLSNLLSWHSGLYFSLTNLVTESNPERCIESWAPAWVSAVDLLWSLSVEPLVWSWETQGLSRSCSPG